MVYPKPNMLCLGACKPQVCRSDLKKQLAGYAQVTWDKQNVPKRKSQVRIRVGPVGRVPVD